MEHERRGHAGAAWLAGGLVLVACLGVKAASPGDAYWINDCGNKALLAERLLETGFRDPHFRSRGALVDPSGRSRAWRSSCSTRPTTRTHSAVTSSRTWSPPPTRRWAVEWPVGSIRWRACWVASASRPRSAGSSRAPGWPRRWWASPWARPAAVCSFRCSRRPGPRCGARDCGACSRARARSRRSSWTTACCSSGRCSRWSGRACEVPGARPPASRCGWAWCPVCSSRCSLRAAAVTVAEKKGRGGFLLVLPAGSPQVALGHGLACRPAARSRGRLRYADLDVYRCDR